VLVSAGDLAGPEGQGAQLLLTFANDTTFTKRDRVQAAWSLAKLPSYRTDGIALLRQFASDPTLGLAAQILKDFE